MDLSEPERALKVLVVDDDESVRDVLRIALSLEDGVAEVRSAGDGREAVTVVRDFEPDVVVLDEEMPSMRGSDAAAEIRKIAPKARIVAFSGTLDAKPNWADGHFVKGTVGDLSVVIRLPDAS
jgi:chemotaxis response regulator CheB